MCDSRQGWANSARIFLHTHPFDVDRLSTLRLIIVCSTTTKKQPHTNNMANLLRSFFPPTKTMHSPAPNIPGHVSPRPGDWQGAQPQGDDRQPPAEQNHAPPKQPSCQSIFGCDHTSIFAKTDNISKVCCSFLIVSLFLTLPLPYIYPCRNCALFKLLRIRQFSGDRQLE